MLAQQKKQLSFHKTLEEFNLDLISYKTMTNTFLLMPHSFNVQSPQSECLIPSSTTGELTFNPQRLTNQIRMSLEELYEKGSKVRKALSAATAVHLIGPHAVDSHAHLGCCVACACV